MKVLGGAVQQQLAPVGFESSSQQALTITLTSPANRSVLSDHTPTFAWNAVTGADTYEIEIASDAAFTSIEDTDAAVATNSNTPASPLDETIAFLYWRVRVSAPIVGPWSETRIFSLYIFSDQFITNEAAPIVSPRTAEDGPGTETYLEIDGQYSIVSSQLVMPTQTTSTFGDLGWYSSSHPRRAGQLAHLFFNLSSFPTSGSMFLFGLQRTGSVLSSNTGAAHVVNVNLAGSISLSNNQSPQGVNSEIVVDVDYEAGILELATGAMYFIREAAAARYRLIWSVELDSTATLYLGQSNTTAVGVMDDLNIRMTDGDWATLYGLATNRVASPSDGEVTTMEPDALIEITWACVTSETLEVRFHYTDDNNYWAARATEADNTIKLVSMIGGVETVESSVANTFNNGVSYRIIVMARYADSTHMDYWIHVTNNRRVAVSTTKLDGRTATGVVITGSSSISNLIVWPMVVDDPFVPEVSRYLLAFGDSKTEGAYDFSVMPYLRGGYPAYLEKDLYVATEETWHEITPRMGYGGTTMSLQAGLIDAELALVADTPAPEVITFDIGANDLSTGLVEATWKADTRTVLRALHGKWGSATIRITYPWSKPAAWHAGIDPDIYAGWIDDILSESEFAVYCAAGVDQRIILEGGDAGALEMYDDKHPNHYGYTLLAAAWATLLVV